MFFSNGNWRGVAVADLGSSSEVLQISVADFINFYVISTFGYDSVYTADKVVQTIARVPGAAPGSALFTTLPNASVPKFVTSCNFNGQCVAGGIVSDDYKWAYGLSGVAWSGIGSFDFNPESDRTAGGMPLPFDRNGEGIIYKVLKLGGGVSVYGNFGRCFLKPFGNDVVTGFGFDSFGGAGVVSGNHVAGDDKVQVFIDTNNDVWRVDGSLKQEKLGYREWIDDLTNADIIITYVPERQIFYISDGVTGYGLTPHGMYSMNQLISGAMDYSGTLYGFWGSVGDAEGRIVTGDLDYDSKGIKTIMALEVFGENNSDISCAVDYRYNKTGSFSRSTWKTTSPEGVAFPIVSGVDLRLGVKASAYANLYISGISHHVKFTDKRFSRGISVNKIAARSGE